MLLAFANDEDAYLQMVVKERPGIAWALKEAERMSVDTKRCAAPGT